VTQSRALTDRRLLAPLFVATFAVIYSGTVIGALVTPIAAEFGVTPGSVGLAAAAYATPGILIGLIAGPLSDRFGRGWFLAGGTLGLGSLTIVAAMAPTFEWLAVTRAARQVSARR
jgi:predicted MFS family arabinose efflux permease